MSTEHIIAAIEDTMNTENYDREFYKTMRRIQSLAPEELDDQVRRAILKYITDDLMRITPEKAGLLTMGFIHGYLTGQKMRKDLRKKQPKPPADGADDVKIEYL